jgi:hypothetical protein
MRSENIKVKVPKIKKEGKENREEKMSYPLDGSLLWLDESNNNLVSQVFKR